MATVVAEIVWVVDDIQVYVGCRCRVARLGGEESIIFWVVISEMSVGAFENCTPYLSDPHRIYFVVLIRVHVH